MQKKILVFLSVTLIAGAISCVPVAPASPEQAAAAATIAAAESTRAAVDAQRATLMAAANSQPQSDSTPSTTVVPSPTNVPLPTNTDTLTPEPEASRKITDDTCVEGICLEVAAVSWFLQFVEGDPGPRGMDSCVPRADYTADFAVQIMARNNSNDDVLLQYGDYDFRVEDNTGRQFKLMDFSCNPGLFSSQDYHPESHKMMLSSGEETLLGPTFDWMVGPQGVMGSGRSTTQLFGFKGDIRPETDYLILYVENFSRIPYAAWKYEIPR